MTIPGMLAGREYHVQDEQVGGSVVVVGAGVVSQLQSGVVEVVEVVVVGQDGG